MKTEDTIYNDAVDAAITVITRLGITDPKDIKEQAYEVLINHIQIENAARKANKERPMQVPKNLPNYIIAKLLMHNHHFKAINRSGGIRGAENLYLYDETEGIYLIVYNSMTALLRSIAQVYNYNLREPDLSEIYSVIMANCEKAEINDDKSYCPVGNGIWNFKTQQLEPFSPDKIFIAKIATDYNPLAQNVMITEPDGTVWDFRKWLDDLTDDPEVRDFFWNLPRAIVRRYIRVDRMVFFYNTRGCNGKGSYALLLKEMIGESNIACIPIDDFQNPFMLTPLINAYAIIADEVSTEEFLRNASNLKAVVTGDDITINVKHKDPVKIRFEGMVIQCLNGPVKSADKTDSWYRRQIYIPFDKTFIGKENKNIKSVYLRSKEVLEYLLRESLETDITELKIPRVSDELLQEIRIENDPVRAYYDELMPTLTIDLVPFEMAYEMFNIWYKKNYQRDNQISKTKFIRETREIFDDNDVWSCSEKNVPVTVGKKMDGYRGYLKTCGLNNLFFENKSYNGIVRKGGTKNDKI